MMNSLRNAKKKYGWYAFCMPIEVDSRGFMARPLCKTLADIGLKGTKKKESHRNDN